MFATYALSRFKLVGKENIFFWTITNRMAPPAVFLLPLFLLYTQAFAIGDWKLYDTRIGLILLYCVFNLPFAIWTMRSVIDGIPKELDEAAMIDGANTWQILTKVIIPLARPGLAVTAILTWVFAWNEYLFAATLTSVHARTITTGLAEFVTVTGTNWGQMAATATLDAAAGVAVPGPGAAPHRRRPDLRRGEGVGAWRKTATAMGPARRRGPGSCRSIPMRSTGSSSARLFSWRFTCCGCASWRLIFHLYVATALSLLIGAIIVARG